MLRAVARQGLLKGKTIGIDATTLEANAAMRSIVRRDTSESYMEYLRRLAAEAGIGDADDEALRRMDRKRKKKTSNDDWVNPHDPEAEVTQMKDGTTHLAYKAEQAVDLETGAIVAITTHGGATGDTTSVQETLPAAGVAVAEQIATPTAQGRHEQGMCEVVGDNGITLSRDTVVCDRNMANQRRAHGRASSDALGTEAPRRKLLGPISPPGLYVDFFILPCPPTTATAR